MCEYSTDSVKENYIFAYTIHNNQAPINLVFMTVSADPLSGNELELKLGLFLIFGSEMKKASLSFKALCPASSRPGSVHSVLLGLSNTVLTTALLHSN